MKRHLEKSKLMPVILFLGIMTAIPLLCSTLFANEAPGFFRYPHTDGQWVVFTSEGDLWRVPIEGDSAAIRLTTHEGEERFAHFSLDGKLIAFTGQDDGQDDVYVMPSSGGEPRRLTYHPDRDQVVGWTPDGEVLFRSTRDIPYRGYRIYRISPDGGFPEMIRLDKATLISHEPNGSRIAFNRYSREFRTWKRYKGGWAQDIWVGDLKKDEFKNVTDNPEINDWDGTDAFPMWHTDGRIYYLSDRTGRLNIHSMEADGSGQRQHTYHDDFDARWAAMGGGLIVYQLGMDIWSFDIATERTARIPVMLPTDRVQARDKVVDPKKYITDFELSPDGKRLLICARGEVFTVPAKGEGLIRQLTWDSGTREKNPQWTPDGKQLVFWSDQSGEEMLYCIPAEGGRQELIGSDSRGWHFPVEISPDGKSAVFGNEELELIVIDLKSGKTRVIDTGDWEIREYAWSGDSRFLAYTRPEANLNSTIHIWDSKEDEIHAVTDDFTNSFSPVFDPEGKYLHFLSDRIANPHLDGMEMTYILDKRTMPYVVMLKEDTESPFLPKADPEEEDDEDWSKFKDKKDDKKKEDEKVPAKVEIDFDGLAQRIVPVPVDPGNYFNLQAVKNKVFYLSYENKGMLGRSLFEGFKKGLVLHRYDLKKEKHKRFAEGVDGYDISGDGKKIVIWKDGKFEVQGVDGGGEMKWKKDDEDEDKDKGIDLSGWNMRVIVRAEWRQMFREAWRLQRDFFWDPNLHEVDWQGVYDKYAPLAGRISTRDELNDLIGEAFAELNCSHAYVAGGDKRSPEHHPTGVFGADLVRDRSGFYRIERIISGRPWTKKVKSPLGAPGLKVSVGDYIIAVNGRQVDQVPNIYELMINCADKVTSLTVNSKPSPDGSREIIIKPMSNERRLRYYDWIDGRKAYVAEKSDGRIGYIHLTNMGGTGLSQFASEYKPQHNKSALIMDVRYNGGGFVAQMILSHLHRQLVSIGRPRHGANYRSPETAFYGHMAAVSNGETGSDGETFTEGFQRLGLGPVIGTRTWGGWVGIRGDKGLVDRGWTSQPEFTGWGMDGEYLIEGWGTDPDIPVKEHPTAEFYGKDPQLDATIDYLLEKLETEPKPLPQPPKYPDRSGFSR